MKREVIILCDVEMGVGSVNDDFISDQALSELICSLRKRKHAVDLVFNGDTFDFLKAPYIVNKKEYHPIHVTEDVSLNKLNNSIKRHGRVFSALRDFLKDKSNRVVFVIGNHDMDLHFERVQKRIRRSIGRNVEFCAAYVFDSLHVEHGHEFDVLFQLSDTGPFTTYRSRKILNFNWLTAGLIKMAGLKKKHPFMERIKPVPVLFGHYKLLKEQFEKASFRYFLKGIFLYPLCLIDPLKKIPFNLAREFMRRVKTANYEVEVVMDKLMQFAKLKKRKTRIYVLGHEHVTEARRNDGLIFIYCDTWRDEYILNKKTGKVTPKKKNYVQVVIENHKAKWKILTWPVKRSVWNFDDIIHDEDSYIELAKKEENAK